jgi:hypothetical protein
MNIGADIFKTSYHKHLGLLNGNFARIIRIIYGFHSHDIQYQILVTYSVCEKIFSTEVNGSTNQPLHEQYIKSTLAENTKVI